MMIYTIATLASHSCLQILKGAKDEGFRTLAIGIKERSAFYKQFPFIDEFIGLNYYREFLEFSGILRKRKIIVVPHGSFVAYLGKGADEKVKLPYFGNKKILEIEADRNKQFSWLSKAKLLLPKTFTKVEEVDRPVIMKLHGAKGGQGYLFAKNKRDLSSKLKKTGNNINSIYMQEYIVGVPVYLQYFYSPLEKRLELMGIDKRYESNVDGIGRIPAFNQDSSFIEPTFTIIGNIPLVIRESYLPLIYEMGRRVVEASLQLASPRGLYGPFCLETIVTPDQKFYCIEISCRIVAGTNLFVNGSPYTDLLYNESISTGRRIAREIRLAINKGKLDTILD